MWEIVRFCREQGILCQGRGSAANSAVCYCLGITAVDPGAHGTAVRALPLARARRAAGHRPGHRARPARRGDPARLRQVRSQHAAMVCNFIRYRPRSAVRDVGKALGLAETALDRLSKLLSHHGSIDPRRWRRPGSTRHPVHDTCCASPTRSRLPAPPLDPPRRLSARPRTGARPRADRERHDGRPHRDPVGQGLTRRAGTVQGRPAGAGRAAPAHLGFDLLEQHHGKRSTHGDVPHDDEPTYDMICRGDTVGVFQIESRAQMAMLPRLQTAHLLRPGDRDQHRASRADHRRHGAPLSAPSHGEEPVDYPHPCLEPVLKKTLGVPLFQEQVIRLAVVAADYTPGEADQLRRDMAAWRRAAASSGTASGWCDA